MTDVPSDINAARSSSLSGLSGLSRTVRRSEIIHHLTNFRVSVDQAIHTMPGVILGVSCADVIQSAIHLTWHIEQLKGILIDAMLREGINPFDTSDSSGNGNLPPRFHFASQTSPVRPDIRLGPVGRERGLMPYGDDRLVPSFEPRMEPIFNTPVVPSLLRNYQFSANRLPSGSLALNDQVVPTFSHPTYRNNFPIPYGNVPPFRISNISQQVLPENNPLADLNSRPVVTTASQEIPRFGTPAAQTQHD